MAPPVDQDTDELHRAIWSVLGDGTPVVVTSHARLDGDGLGSSLALWHALRQRGVEAHVFLQPPVPSMFLFLPGMDQVCEAPDKLPERFHLAVIDCGCPERTGAPEGALDGAATTINIDHHDSNAGFADVNYVDRQASSCGEMIYGLLQAAGVELDRDLADCLYTAIVTDTGQFSHQDTTPRALEVCAECMRAGAEPHELVRHLFTSPSPAQVKLRHLALGTLRFGEDGRTATMVITRGMFEETGLGPEDTEGFSEVPIAIRGVEASALLKELPDQDYIKVSLRSRGPVDVCAVARVFGGGGHTRAAGCEIRDTMENARRAVAEQLSIQARAAVETS